MMKINWTWHVWHGFDLICWHRCFKRVNCTGGEFLFNPSQMPWFWGESEIKFDMKRPESTGPPELRTSILWEKDRTGWCMDLRGMAENQFCGEIMQFRLHVFARKKSDLFVLNVHSLHWPAVCFSVHQLGSEILFAAQLPKRFFEGKAPIGTTLKGCNSIPGNAINTCFCFDKTTATWTLEQEMVFPMLYRLYTVDCFFP